MKFGIKWSAHNVISVQPLNYGVVISFNLVSFSRLVAASIEARLVLSSDQLPRTRPEESSKPTDRRIWVRNRYCVEVEAALWIDVQHSSIVGLGNDWNIPELTYAYIIIMKDQIYI